MPEREPLCCSARAVTGQGIDPIRLSADRSLSAVSADIVPRWATSYTHLRLMPAAAASALTDAARRWFRSRLELYRIDLTARMMSFSLIIGWSPAWCFCMARPV